MIRIHSILFVLLFVVCVVNTSAQRCGIQSPAFKPGETMQYEVSYNWGFIWIDAGMVDFQASRVKYQGQDAFHFVSTGHSYKNYDWLFKVRDTFEVIASTDLKPLKYKRHTLEGGFWIHNKYVFDHQKRVAYAQMEETRKPYHEETIPLQACTFDVLTATYVARSMDFEHMLPGDTVVFSIVLDGRVFDLPIVYLGKDILTGRDKLGQRCIRFTAVLEKGTMFRSGEAITVWVSDDKYKIPLLIEAKITVGSIKVHLIKTNAGH
ncbi:MAG: DUF3108 domain-containing protein [Bacteroidales bacterium]|nr:DUF3108 domain-containing protein [Bacteroidales bacterium]